MPLFAIEPRSEVSRARHQRLVSRLGYGAKTRLGGFGAHFRFELVGANGGFDGGADRGFEEAEDASALFAMGMCFGGVNVAAFCFVGVVGIVGCCGGDFGGAGAERVVGTVGAEVVVCDFCWSGFGGAFAARWWWNWCVVGFANAEEGYCELCVCLEGKGVWSVCTVQKQSHR